MVPARIRSRASACVAGQAGFEAVHGHDHREVLGQRRPGRRAVSGWCWSETMFGTPAIVSTFGHVPAAAAFDVEGVD